MLKISLDESYVFDLLSIQEVKLAASTGQKREQILKSYDMLRREIVDQLGLTVFNSVIDSVEYLKLRTANKLVFDLVDRAGESKLSKLTADANYDRYLCKKDIQEVFFGSGLTEVKV